MLVYNLSVWIVFLTLISIYLLREVQWHVCGYTYAALSELLLSRMETFKVIAILNRNNL